MRDLVREMGPELVRDHGDETVAWLIRGMISRIEVRLGRVLSEGERAEVAREYVAWDCEAE